MAKSNLSNVSLINLMLFVAILLLVTILVIEPASDNKRESSYLSSTIPENIRRIIIEQPAAEKIVIEKHTSGMGQIYWTIESPIIISADNDKIKNLLNLLHISVEKQFEIKPELLDQYGLAPPKWVLTLDSESLYFGDTEPINHLRYVMAGDKINLIQDRFSQYSFDLPYTLVSLNILPDIRLNSMIKSIRTKDVVASRTGEHWQLKIDDTTHSVTPEMIKPWLILWRDARATRVTSIDSDYLESVEPGNQIEITFENRDKTMIFSVLDNTKSVLLINPENQLTYVLPKPVFRQLVKPDL